MRAAWVVGLVCRIMIDDIAMIVIRVSVMVAFFLVQTSLFINVLLLFHQTWVSDLKRIFFWEYSVFKNAFGHTLSTKHFPKHDWTIH